MQRLRWGARLTAAALGAGTALLLRLPAGALPLLGVAIAAGVLALAYGRRLAPRVGPRNLLHVTVPFLGVVAALVAADDLLRVAPIARFLYAAVGGVAVGTTVAALFAMDPQRSGDGTHLPLGVLAGLVFGGSLAWASPALTLLAIILAVFVAWRLLHGARDPLVPADPLRPWMPWGDADAPRLTRWRRVVPAPWTTAYLLLSWGLFIPWAEPHPDGIHVLPRTVLERFGYRIPDLLGDPLQALRALVTAPFLNHDSVQLVYVTVLLLLFAVPLERREGGARTLAVFFATSIVAALIAGSLLHVLRPTLQHPILDDAWGRVWSGGSAGAFGVLGAVAGRAPIPWPLLGFFVFWEGNVGLWFLQSYTPAFHLSALAVGFVWARRVGGRRRPRGAEDPRPAE